jgi:hypothetical protein
VAPLAEVDDAAELAGVDDAGELTAAGDGVWPSKLCTCFAVGVDPTGTAFGASAVGVNGVDGPVGVARFGFGV